MATVTPADISASQHRYSCYPRAEKASSSRDYAHYDLITFLEACQTLDIEFFPITWQPALDALGVDGQSTLRRSLLGLALKFAFSRVEPRRGGKEREVGEEEIYRALVSHISILREPEISVHPNIIRLIGVCWEIRPFLHEDQHPIGDPKQSRIQVWPVLVVEKSAHGDLTCFMRSTGKDLNLLDRLKLCIDIAKGIRELHKNRIIHRNIKPHSVMIFESGSTTPRLLNARIGDLGHSIRLLNDDETELMPQSLPWQAPEWHHRGFTFAEMMKMEVYSFGLICLWVLFYEKLQENGITLVADSILYASPLERKARNHLSDTAARLSHEATDSLSNQSVDLAFLFESCLAFEQASRAPSLDILIGILEVHSTSSAARASNQVWDPNIANKDPSPSAPFRISRSGLQFYMADYRVRRHIATCLSQRLTRSGIAVSSTHSEHASFQLAICYRIGFGLDQDYQKAIQAVRESGKIEEDLDREISNMESVPFAIRDQLVQQLAFTSYDATDDPLLDPAHYNLPDVQWQLTKDLAALSYLADPSRLKWCVTYQLSRILFVTGLRKEAEELLVRIKTTMNPDHPDFVSCIRSLCTIQMEERRWNEAARLSSQVLETRKLEDPEPLHTLESMEFLAQAHDNLGQRETADVLHNEVIQRRQRLLGVKHPATVRSMLILALRNYHIARYVEAEELATKALEINETTIGAEHPFTLANMNDLIVILQEQSRFKDAWELAVKLKVLALRVFGAEHHKTLAYEVNRAAILLCQNYFNDAGVLLSQIATKQAAILGPNHQYTLTTISNLAAAHLGNGRRTNARQMLNYVVPTAERVLGVNHPFTESSRNFAASLRESNRHQAVDELRSSLNNIEESILSQKAFANEEDAAERSSRTAKAAEHARETGTSLTRIGVGPNLGSIGAPFPLTGDFFRSVNAEHESSLVFEEPQARQVKAACQPLHLKSDHGKYTHAPLKYSKTETVRVDERTAKTPYLDFPLGPGKLRHLVVKTWSMDQGWCDDHLKGSDPYAHSHTWFALGLIRETGSTVEYNDQDLHEFQRNVRASKQLRCHTNEWSVGAPVEGSQDDDLIQGWLESLAERDGVRIGVFARARYPGWWNTVSKVEVEVYCEPRENGKQEGIK